MFLSPVNFFLKYVTQPGYGFSLYTYIDKVSVSLSADEIVICTDAYVDAGF